MAPGDGASTSERSSSSDADGTESGRAGSDVDGRGGGDEEADIDGRAGGDGRADIDGDEPGDAGAGSPPEAAGPTATAAGRREVEVPPSLYRVVTVFSTLLAILLVVLGFTLLGSATAIVSNPPGSLVVRVLSLAAPMGTLVAYSATIALAVGLSGLAAVAAGAAVYVYGSRFRAPGMGKPKDASDEESDDG